ncbi:MAG: alpha-amylase family glycosyl hydrolase [Myxococcota bacterium]
MGRRIRDLGMTLAISVGGLACGSSSSGPDAGSSTPDAGGSTPDAGAVPDMGIPDSGLVEGRLLHVPSPKWEDQVIYFVLLDRFANGDPTNDDQGMGEFDPADGRKFSGGDLKGLIDQLDYIQGLGATAVWITPPVANQWWDPLVEFGGYHGYWARDPKAVDEHFGTLETYKDLSDALHRRGMYLIQDVVPNHLGNFFSWSGAYDSANPESNFVLNSGSVPTTAPVAPWDQNDVRNPDHRGADLYHFTPQIQNFESRLQETTWAISDLDDLKTENPRVRALLRDAYGYWVREVGVDGFRLDTAKYVEAPFWNDFFYSASSDFPGIEEVAKRTGRDNFLSFGEIFNGSGPFADEGETFISSYLNDPTGPGLDAALQFPLYTEIQRVIAEGGATALLGYRLERLLDTNYFPSPFLNPTFIDNHDVQRFIAGSNDKGQRQALALIAALPGIPVIYQGTEQSVPETRRAMFKEGFDNPGVDLYVESVKYRFVRGLLQLRAAHPVLRGGDVTTRSVNPRRSGGLAFTRSLQDNTALMLMNTSDGRALVDRVATGLPEGQVLTRLDGSFGAEELVVGSGGFVTLEMGGRDWMLLIDSQTNRPVQSPAATISLTTDLSRVVTGATTLTGASTGATDLVLVIDEAIDAAVPISPEADGTWSVELPLRSFGESQEDHVLSVYDRASGVSVRETFRTRIPFDGITVDMPDPRDDDRGPSGTYTYPMDASFSRPQDIVGLTVRSGNSLTLEFEMREHSTVWSPQNGYDHVSFNIYFDVPGQDGVTVLPLINGTAPADFAWDFTHFSFGWANRLHSSMNASEGNMGSVLNEAPALLVKDAERKIAFTYNPTSLGLTSWQGVKVYVTVWDFDGLEAKYRPISPDGGQWAYGGAREDAPKIMDSMGPFEVPVP